MNSVLNDNKNILRSINNYTWQDVVRLSIENNISIERFIKRQYKNLSNNDIKQLVKYISEEIKNTI